MRLFLLFLFFLINSLAFAQGDNLFPLSQKLSGTTYLKLGNNITDKNGGVFVCGEYKGTLNSSFPSTGTAKNIFIARFDNNYNLLWIKTVTSASDILNPRLTLTSNKELILIASFKNDCNFFNEATLLKYGTAVAHTFITKYKIDGTYVGVAQSINNFDTYDNPTSIIADPNSSGFYITGNYQQNASLFGQPFNAPSMPSPINSYIAKIKSDGTSSFVKYLYTNGNTSIQYVVPLNDGGSYIGGTFTGTLNIASTAIQSSNGGLEIDIFLARLNSMGDVLWVRRSSNGGSENTWNAVVDNNNDIYFTGIYRGNNYSYDSISPTIQSHQINNLGSSDIFVTKYYSNGNLAWFKSINSTADEVAVSIALENNNNITIGSYFSSSLKIGNDNFTTSGLTDYLLFKLSTNGSEIGGTKLGGTSSEVQNLIWNHFYDIYDKVAFVYNSSPLVVGSTTYTKAVASDQHLLLVDICPIIGIFENPTTTNLYVDPSKPQTGTIELDVKGDVLGGYSYQWSKKGDDFSRSSLLTNLGPDTTYTVKVDYLGSKCSKTRSFTVLRSITEKSTALTNPTNCTAKDGSITAVVTNNTNGKYTVVEASIDSATWITGIQSGNDYTFNFPALTNGNYQLYYRLTVGTGTYHSLLGSKIFITEAGNTITWKGTTVNPIRCNVNTGSIAVSASTTSAGSLTYSVTTSSPPNYIAQNSYSNLTAGTYYINIADGSCEYRAAAVNLTNPAPLTINSTNISTCYSGTNGGISVKAEGGTPPYQYQLSNGGTTVKPFQTSNVFSGLAASSNYTVTVKDVYGCTYTTPAINLESLTSSLSISLSSIVSHYYNSIIPGKIIIIADGGTNSTFTYNINPTGYTQTQSNFENLLPYKYYTITILHNAGCSYSEQFEIKDLNQAYPLVYRKPN